MEFRHSRTKCLFLLTISFLAQGASLIHAAPPTAPASAEKQASAGAPQAVVSEEALFNRKAQAFYKSHIEIYKKNQEQKKNLTQQMVALINKNKSVTNPDEKKKNETQLAVFQKQQKTLALAIARQDMAAAEFGIQVAQRRLEAAKKKLALAEKQP